MAVPPELVMRVVEAQDGGNPSLFAEKMLTYCDTNQHHNRFLFHKHDVTNFILPLLSEFEKKKANLEYYCNNINGISGTEAGLPVELYTINGWKFSQLLLRYRDSGGLVLNGADWKNVRVIGQLQAGDFVQLWSFRKHQDNALCLIIIKI